jgi:hypothetical protein
MKTYICDVHQARRIAKPLPDGLELLHHDGLTGQFHETGEEDLTGTDLAREIRRLRSDIPIVLMGPNSRALVRPLFPTACAITGNTCDKSGGNHNALHHRKFAAHVCSFIEWKEIG